MKGVYRRVEPPRDVHRRGEALWLALPDTPLGAADALHLALAASARAASRASLDARLGAARAAGLAACALRPDEPAPPPWDHDLVDASIMDAYDLDS